MMALVGCGSTPVEVVTSPVSQRVYLEDGYHEWY